MKTAKRTLSVILSFLMLITSVSVAFTALDFTAAAASASDVKSAVNSMSSNAKSIVSGTTINSDSVTFSGDDGTLSNAVSVAYNYVTGAYNTGNRYTTNNSPDAMYTNLRNAGVADKTAHALVYPTGTTTYPYSTRTNSGQTKSGSKTHVGGWTPGSGNFASIPGNVTKTITVNIDINKYLIQNYSSVSQISSSIPLTRTVTYNITSNVQAGSYQGGDNNDTSKDFRYSRSGFLNGKVNWTTYAWNYYTGASNNTSNNYTSAKSDLTAIQNFYNKYAKMTETQKIENGVSMLNDYNNIKNLSSKYTDDVLNKFIASGARSTINSLGSKAQTYANAYALKAYEDNYLQYSSLYNTTKKNADSYKTLEKSYQTTMTNIASNAASDKTGFGNYSDDIYTVLLNAYGSTYSIFKNQSTAVNLASTLQNNALEQTYQAAAYQNDADSKSYLETNADTVTHINDLYAQITEITGTAADNEYKDIVSESDYNTIVAFKGVIDAYVANLDAAGKGLSSVTDTDGVSFSDIIDEDNYQKLKDLSVTCQALITGNDKGEDPYKSVYVDNNVNVQLFIDFDLLTKEQIVSYYNNLVDQQDDIKTVYNNSSAISDAAVRKAIFTVYYEGESMLITDAVAKKISEYSKKGGVIQTRNDQQIKDVNNALAIYNQSGKKISFTNYTSIGSPVATFSENLYQLALSLGLVTDSQKTTHDSTLKTLQDAINAFQENGGFNTWKDVDDADSNGVFTTRYAGDNKNSSGDEIGYVNDIARGGEYDTEGDDDYTVTKAKVNETIVKINNFATSNDFVNVLGISKYRERDDDDNITYTQDISNLSEYIEVLLNRKLFTNDIVSTVLAALYPTVCNLLDGLGDTLSKQGGIFTTPRNGATLSIDLAALNIDLSSVNDRLKSLTGNIDIYMDGKNGSLTYPELAAALGLYIYPSTLASNLRSSNETYVKKFVSNNSAFINKLSSAGRNWLALDVVDKTGKTGADGKISKEDINYYLKQGTVTGKDEQGNNKYYMWGITGKPSAAYSEFLNALGIVIEPVKKLLITVLTNTPLSASLEKAAVVSSNNIKLYYSFFGNHNIGLSVSNQDASANITIGSTKNGNTVSGGLQLYDKLWIPVMEALGITDSGYDISTAISKGARVSGSGTNAVYQFRKLTGSSSTADMTRALVEPLLVLIDQLKYKPVHKVCEIIPNLFYHLAMNSLQNIINSVTVEIGIQLNLQSLNVKTNGSGFDDWIVGAAASLFNNAIRNAINNNAKFVIDLALSSLVNLKEILGFDYTDVNALINFILQKADSQMILPTIDMGNFIQRSDLTPDYKTHATKSTQSATRSSRYFIDADAANVFYGLFDYVFTLLKDTTSLDSIIQNVSKNGVSEDIIDIINLVSKGMNEKDCFAALTELFVPNVKADGTSVYELKNYDWYTFTDYKISGTGDYSQTGTLSDDDETFDLASKVYVTNEYYGRRWTREKAEDVVNNLDGLLKTLIEALGSSEDATEVMKNTSEFLSSGLLKAFTSRGLASPLRILVNAGASLYNSKAGMNVLKSETGTFTNGVSNNDGFDLLYWFDNYKAVFPFTVPTRIVENDENKNKYPDFPNLTEFEASLASTGTFSEGDDGTVTYTPNAGASVNVGNIKVTYRGEDNARKDDFGFYDIAWNGTVLNQGDYETFLSLFTGLFENAAPIIALFLDGRDITPFNGALTIKGFKGYESAIYDLYKILGVPADDVPAFEYTATTTDADGNKSEKKFTVNLEGLITPDEYNELVWGSDGKTYSTEGAAKAFNRLSTQIFDYLIYLLTANDGNLIKTVIERIPAVVYYIESNGLSVAIHNALQSIFVIIDVIRPLVDVDINSTASVFLTELLKGSDKETTVTNEDGTETTETTHSLINTKFDIINIVKFILGDTNTGLSADYSIDLTKLKVENLLYIIDQYLGTNLHNSPIMHYGIPGLIKDVDQTVSNRKNFAYKSLGTGETQDSRDADTLTVALSMLLDTLTWGKGTASVKIGAAAGETLSDNNGTIIVKFLEDNIPSIDKSIAKIFGDGVTLSTVYNVGVSLLTESGVNDVQYYSPNWLYMYKDATFENLASQTIDDLTTPAQETTVYLDYKNNWSKSTAASVESTLMDVLKNFKISYKDENDQQQTGTISELVTATLNKTIYSEDTFDTVFGKVYEFLSKYNAQLIQAGGAALGIDVQTFLQTYAVKTDNGDGTYTYKLNDKGAYSFNKDYFSGKFVKSGDKAADGTTYTEETAAEYNKKAFDVELRTALTPLNSLFDWFLFGQDYEFFNKVEKVNSDGTYDYTSIIKFPGFKGYNQGLVYLAEALLIDEGADTASGVYTADHYRTSEAGAATTTYDGAQAVADVIDGILKKLDAGKEDPMGTLMPMLLNLIYFIDADGLTTIVKNIFAPIDTVLKQLNPTLTVNGVEYGSSYALVKQLLTGVLAVKDSDSDTVKSVKNIVLNKLDTENSWDGLFNWDTVFALVATLTDPDGDGEGQGITFNDEAKEIIANFYLGSLVSYTSANGLTAAKMVFNALDKDKAAQDRVDFETILLSIVIETVLRKENKAAVVKILGENGENIYDAVYALVKGETAADYDSVNWDYLDDGAGDKDQIYENLKSWADQYVESKKPSYMTENGTCVYLNYEYKEEAWTLDASEKLISSANAIIDQVLKLLADNGQNVPSSVAQMVQGALDGTLYYVPADSGKGTEEKKSVLETTLVPMVAKLLYELGDTIEKQAGVSYDSVYDLVGKIFGADLKAWMNKVNVTETTDENGETVKTYTVKDEYLDEVRPTNAEEFGQDLAAFLKPAGGLIAWLLLGQDYKFFNDEQHVDIITIAGGKGYDNGLVYILEALGLEGLKSSDAYKKSDGTYDTDKLLDDIGTDIADVLESISKDPIGKALDILPNLIYFIGADGLTVSVKNLLAPVLKLLSVVSKVTGSSVLDLEGTLEKYGLKYDTATGSIDLSWDALFDVVASVTKDKNGNSITVPDEVQAAVNKLYLGGLKTYNTYADKTAAKDNGYVKMESDDLVVKANTLTVIVSLAGDVLKDPANKVRIVELLAGTEDQTSDKYKNAESQYEAVINILNGVETAQDAVPSYGYVNPDTANLGLENFKKTEANSSVTITYPSSDSVTTNALYLQYDNNWTKETADSLDSIIETIADYFIKQNNGKEITKIGDSAITVEGDSIGSLVKNLLNDQIITTDNFASVIGMVYGLLEGLDADIFKFLGIVPDTDVTAWMETYGDLDSDTNKYSFNKDKTLASIASYASDGKFKSEQDFVNAVIDVLNPLDGILSWLLLGTSYGFFNSAEAAKTGSDYFVTLNGGYGYKTAVAFLLEALSIDTSEGNIPTTDIDALEKGILNAVIAKIDEIENSSNAVTSLVSLLPNLIYFFDAGGLGAAIDNLIAPISGIMAQIGPFTDGKYVNLVQTLKDTINDALQVKDSDGNKPAKGDDKYVDFIGDATTFKELLTMNKVLEIAEHATGIVIPDAVKNVLENFYIGKLERIDNSGTGIYTWKMVLDGSGDVGSTTGDMETLLISLVLETALYSENKDAVIKLLGDNGETKYEALKAIISGQTFSESDMITPDWDYLNGAAGDLDQIKAKLVSYAEAYDSANSGNYRNSFVYLTYDTNWTSEKAETVVGKLSTVIDAVLSMTAKGDEDKSSLSAIIKKAVNGKIYGSDSVLQNLVVLAAEQIAKLAKDICKSSGLSEDTLYDAIKNTLGVDLAKWTKEMVTFDDDGKATLTDEAKAQLSPADSSEFGSSLAAALSPAAGLLNWLLFGGSYKFFNDSEGKDIITVSGGYGYAYGLAYLLEVIGVEGMKTAAYYTPATVDETTAKMTSFLTDLGNGLAKWLDKVEDDPVNQIIEVLPSLVYFIGADGLTAVVSNILKPVTGIISQANIIAGKELLDINDIVDDYGLSYSDGKLDLSWNTLFSVIKKLTGITVPEKAQEQLEKLYLGNLEADDAISGVPAGGGFIKMLAETAAQKADFLTIVVSLAVDTLEEPVNKDAIVALIAGKDATADQLAEAEKKYDAVMNIVKGAKIDDNDYQVPDYGYMDEGYTVEDYFNGKAPEYPADTYTNCAVYLKYQNAWSKDGIYTLDYELESLVNMVLYNYVNSDNKITDEDEAMTQLITSYVTGAVYNKKTIDSVLELVWKALSGIDENIVEVAGAALDADAKGWLDSHTETDSEGNKVFKGITIPDGQDEKTYIESNYTSIIRNELKPLDGVLSWLLLGNNYTFLDDSELDNGNTVPLITISGGNGYAKSLAYIFDILGVDLSKVNATDIGTLETTLINGTIAAVKAIEDDPIEGALQLVTRLVYFLNANGAGVVVDNLLVPATELLEIASPVTGTDSSVVQLLKDTINGALQGKDADGNKYKKGDDGYVDYVKDAKTFKELLTTDNILLVVKNLVGLTIPDGTKELIEKFYIGELTKKDYTTSGTGYIYDMTLRAKRNDSQNDRADMETILISIILDTLGDSADNRDFVLNTLKLTDKQYDAILALYKDTENYTYTIPNWTFLNTDGSYDNSSLESLKKYVADYTASNAKAKSSCTYLRYDNDWYRNATSSNADAIVASLDGLVDYIIQTIQKDKSTSLGAYLKKLVADSVYGETTDKDGNAKYTSVLNDLVATIAKAIYDYQDYLKLVDVFFGTDIQSWITKAEDKDASGNVIYYDADGNVTDKENGTPKFSSENLGYDPSHYATFGDALQAVLEPVNPVLGWLLFGGKLTFFYTANDNTELGKTAGDDQIILTGGKGYDNALVYLLEALGCEPSTLALTAANGGKNADGSVNVSGAVKVIGNAVAARLDDLETYDKSTNEGTVAKVLNLIPNLLYFVGANGIGTVVSNLLVPADKVIGVANAFLSDDKQIDINSLVSKYINDAIKKALDNTAAKDVEIDYQNITWDKIFEIVEAFGVDIPDQAEKEIKSIVFGTLTTYDSENGTHGVQAFGGSVQDRTDLITVIVSFAGDIIKNPNNKSFITKLLGADDDPASEKSIKAENQYNAVIKLLDGDTQAKYEAPDWGYMDSSYTYTIDDLDNMTAPKYPSNVEDTLLYNVYNRNWRYENNWNEETAEIVMGDLSKIADAVLVKFTKESDGLGKPLASIVKDLLDSKVYTMQGILDVISAVYDLVGGLNDNVVIAAGELLGADIYTWLNTYGGKNSEGNYEFDSAKAQAKIEADTGITSSDEITRDNFAKAVKSVLSPYLDSLVEWLLLGDDYKFMKSSDNSTLLTIKGGEGYANGLVYILEALGCECLANRTDISTASEVEDTILTGLLNRVDEIQADPVNEIVALLPNIIYFINTNGLGASVDNLIAPVNALVEVAMPFISSDSDTSATVVTLLKDTINDALQGKDADGNKYKKGDDGYYDYVGDNTTFLDLLNFKTVFAVLDNMLGITVPADDAKVIEEFYIGRLTAIDSANNHSGFRMEFSEDAEGDSHKASTHDAATMLTVIIGVLADTAMYSDNLETILEMFKVENADTAADTILKVLSDTGDLTYSDYQAIKFTMTDKADTGEVVSAISTSKKYADPYVNSKYWTREMATDVAEHLDRFIGNLLCLLGLTIDGVKITSVEQLVQMLIKDKIYNNNTVDKILGVFKSTIMEQIKNALGDYLADEVVKIVKSALGVDLKAYENMEITYTVNDGASFRQAMEDIIRPLLPLLNVLLNGKNISLFYKYDGGDVITIRGSEGYKYGIIPLLEALSCTGITSPADFSAAMTAACETGASDAQKNKAIDMVLNPIINKLSEIQNKPVTTLFNMLPEVIYYIDSNGVDASVNNMVAGINKLLASVAPVLGKDPSELQVDKIIKIKGQTLYDLTFDFPTLVKLVLNMVNEDLGTTLTPVVLDAVNELTTGTVNKYESANGDHQVNKQYYKMVYANNEADKTKAMADVITIVGRILIDFVTDSNNLPQIEALLKKYIKDEDTYGYVDGVLKELSKTRTDDPTFGEALYVLYKLYLFVEKAVDEGDLAYHDVNNTWAFAMKMMNTSDDPVLNAAYKLIKGLITKYVEPDVVDPDSGVAPNGFIKFFQSIAEFFKKLAELFKKIFKH